MSSPIKKVQKQPISKKERTANLEERKAIACLVSQKILETQEKIDKTLEELSTICKQRVSKK